MKAYLHIGTAKTGTTAIQSFLYNHRQKLLENNILYPDVGIAYSAHGLLFRDYLNQERASLVPWKHDKQKLSDLQSHIQKHHDKTLLLSSEFCSRIKDVERLHKDLLSLGIDVVKIIVYLRRQDYFCESMYNQIVKGPTKQTENFKTFCLRISQRINWWELTQKWAEVFGENNLIVRVFEKQQLPRGVVYDFLQILDLCELHNDASLPKMNPSVDLDLIAIKRLANIAEYALPEPLIYSLNEKLQGFPKEKYLFSRGKRQQLLQDFSQTNAQVAKKYFNREQLFDDRIPEEEDSYSGMKTEKSTLVLFSLLKEAQVRTQKTTKRYRRLKKVAILLGVIILLNTIAVGYLFFQLS